MQYESKAARMSCLNLAEIMFINKMAAVNVKYFSRYRALDYYRSIYAPGEYYYKKLKRLERSGTRYYFSVIPRF